MKKWEEQQRLKNYNKVIQRAKPTLSKVETVETVQKHKPSEQEAKETLLRTVQKDSIIPTPRSLRKELPVPLLRVKIRVKMIFSCLTCLSSNCSKHSSCSSTLW